MKFTFDPCENCQKDYFSYLRTWWIAIIIFLMFFALFSFVSADTLSYNTYLGEVNQGDSILIKQSCSSCSYVNVSVLSPSNVVISNQPMSYQGSGLWTYSFSETSDSGLYNVVGSGDILGVDTSFGTLSFDVVRPKLTDNILYVDFSSSFYQVVLVLWVIIILVMLFVGWTFLASFLSLFLSLTLMFSGVNYFISLVPTLIALSIGGSRN